MWKFVILLLTRLAFTDGHKTECIVISKQAFTVDGYTSLGSFTCTYELFRTDTFYAGMRPADPPSVKYRIPSDAFGCGNFLLNRDFKKTIKAKEFKEIQVEITNFRKKDNCYSCDIKLLLAGKDKVYRDTFLRVSGKKLLGCLIVHFSEFDLAAPKKMGGLIKVKEDIKITMDLTME